MTSGEEMIAEIMATGMYTALVFLLGVSWALYRAITWQERMRRWAHSLDLPYLSGRKWLVAGTGVAGVPVGVRDPASALCLRSLDGMGDE
jgi:hypothetical protein